MPNSDAISVRLGKNLKKVFIATSRREASFAKLPVAPDHLIS